MSGDALYAHLESGATTVCRAWTVRRLDGVLMGFTDHDQDLTVDGVVCSADTGMTARALQQTTGLAVDNSEAAGALNDASIREADLLAGRFDGAEVRSYLVNWAAPTDWIEQFRGTFGEILRAGGAFRAELRGLTEALNRPQGFAYLQTCSAVLGDARCGFDTALPGFFFEGTVEAVVGAQTFTFVDLAGFDDRWFDHGRFEMVTGAAAGLVASIKSDRQRSVGREVELWQSLGADVLPGDIFRMIAGCDKSAATCRVKFGNFLYYRGFPHIPGEDWLTSYPLPDRPSTGGARLPAIGL